MIKLNKKKNLAINKFVDEKKNHHKIMNKKIC